MIGAQTAMAEMQKIAELIKYATIVVSSAPLLIMFPFFQNTLKKALYKDLLKVKTKNTLYLIRHMKGKNYEEKTLYFRSYINGSHIGISRLW